MPIPNKSNSFHLLLNTASRSVLSLKIHYLPRIIILSLYFFESLTFVFTIDHQIMQNNYNHYFNRHDTHSLHHQPLPQFPRREKKPGKPRAIYPSHRSRLETSRGESDQSELPPTPSARRSTSKNHRTTRTGIKRNVAFH